MITLVKSFASIGNSDMSALVATESFWGKFTSTKRAFVATHRLRLSLKVFDYMTKRIHTEKSGVESLFV